MWDTVRTLLLIRNASTAATRAAAFPDDEPLDDRGQVAAAGLAGALPSRFDALCSPALRCRMTATAAGLSPQTDPELAGWDLGSWAGRSLAEVHAAEPAAAAAWMTDPDARAHGGESLRAFCERIAGWLDRQARLDGRVVAITHGGVIKAAVVHALDAPVAAFWQVDVAPLSITELHAHDGRWTLSRANHPTGARSA
jgi:broad specificity phosphatase PhoE